MPLVVALNVEFVPAADLNNPLPLFLKVALTVLVIVVEVDIVIFPSILFSSTFSTASPDSCASLNSASSWRFSSSQNLIPTQF